VALPRFCRYTYALQVNDSEIVGATLNGRNSSFRLWYCPATAIGGHIHR